jgi:hypothetical protein
MLNRSIDPQPDLSFRLSKDYLPSTFEERGSSVPFTTPELAYSRIRKSPRGELEILIPGFSGSRGIYVFPWRRIPSTVLMNLHDRTLHAEIMQEDVIAPDRMRMAAHRVAISGLGGPVLMSEAKRLLADDAREAAAANWNVLLRAVQGIGLPLGKDLLGQALIGGDKTTVRTAFRQIAEAVQTDPETFFDRAREFSRLIHTVGFDEEGARGRLRSLYQRIQNFAETTASCNLPEAGRLMAEVALVTLRVGAEPLAAVECDLNQVVACLRNWPKRIDVTRHQIERLSWLLDGWQHVCDLWDRARADRETPEGWCVTEILRILPIVPRNECEPAARMELDTLARRQGRIVREFQDWRSGRMDQDMMSRVEASKTGQTANRY